MSRRFFDRTADLVGQLNGNGQKVMLQIDAPLSKISGYATGADTTGTVPVPWAGYFQW